MRLSLLLVLAVCALFTDRASAQSEFHIAWGRHLGWGSGPGYHSYSQDEIHSWMADCQQATTGCSSCATFAPLPLQDGLSGGASGYPPPTGPRLAPPQFAPPQIAPPQFAPPQFAPPEPSGPAAAPSIVPAPLPAAPSAFNLGPPFPPQFAGRPQANFIPPHFTNPLITPTGTASWNVRPAASASPRTIHFGGYPTNATGYPHSMRRP